MSLFRKISCRIQRYVSFIYPSVLILEGLEKNTKFPLTIAYVGLGLNPPLEHYWGQLNLEEGFKKHDIGRCFIWDILSFLRVSSFKCDSLLLEENSLTSKFIYAFPGFRIPYWIKMELDIAAPIEELLGSQRSEIQRKIRKNKLSYIVAKDKGSFDDFYYNMYLPYAQTRYSLTALLFTYQQLWGVFSRGGLILIKKEEKVVAGELYEFIGSEVKYHSLGIRDGKSEYLQCGVLGAAYYFILVEMKKHGYAKLLIGGARPFLKDGVTRHKISLGAYLIKDKECSCLWLGLLRDSVGLKGFLINNPFVFLDEKKDFYRAIFGEIKEGKISPECEDVIKSSCAGLDGAVFFSFDKLNNGQDKSFLNETFFDIKFIGDKIIK